MHSLCAATPMDFVYTGAPKTTCTYVITRCSSFYVNKDKQVECAVTCVVGVVVLVVVLVVDGSGGGDGGGCGGGG